MRQHVEHVAGTHRGQRHIDEPLASVVVSHARRPSSKGFERGRGAPRGALLQRLTARQHEDHDDGDEVFAEQRGRDDRETGKKI